MPTQDTKEELERQPLAISGHGNRNAPKTRAPQRACCSLHTKFTAGGGSGVGDPRGSARARCPGLRPALYYNIFPCPGLRPARDGREFSRARACCANFAGARLAHLQDVAIAARCCIKPNPQTVGTLRGHTPALCSALHKDAIGTGLGHPRQVCSLEAGQSLDPWPRTSRALKPHYHPLAPARERAHWYTSQLQVRACMHASAAIARRISSGLRPRSIQVTEARQGKGQNCCRGGE